MQKVWYISGPKMCSNIQNLRIVLRIVSKENRQKYSLLKSKTNNVLFSSSLYDGVCYLPFSILEDESLIALWGSIMSYNSSLKCKLYLDERLLFKNWSWRWIWSSGGKFLQFLRRAPKWWQLAVSGDFQLGKKKNQKSIRHVGGRH